MPLSLQAVAHSDSPQILRVKVSVVVMGSNRLSVKTVVGCCLCCQRSFQNVIPGNVTIAISAKSCRLYNFKGKLASYNVAKDLGIGRRD